MGTWNTDNVDLDHADYNISVSLDGITSCGASIKLVDSGGGIPQADAEDVLDALLTAIGTDVNLTVYGTNRVYRTYETYTP